MVTEMGMRADEETGIGQDITPPLLPLASALHLSFIHSHCFSCFSPLPLPLHLPSPSPSPSPLYCSPLCSSSFPPADSALLLHPHSSDLRVALRLLSSLPSPPHARISGLLTNRDKLMEYEDMSARIADGARAMAAASGGDFVESNENDVLLLQAAFCAVITNAVEVLDNQGRALGIAVYGHNFSWINHSCSPNACYRFLISPPSGSLPFPTEPKLRIVPITRKEDTLPSNDELSKGSGPRVIVRSIKRIKKGEEVTVAYTDLLQPKEIRELELWSKYCFICCCTRCSGSSPSYVDHILQEISDPNMALSGLSSSRFCGDESTRKLSDYFDEVINEYLTVGDAESCCMKLESILFLNLFEHLGTKKRKSQLCFGLHPLNHLALNAYMTLASAYKIRASDALNLDKHSYQLEVFDMSRASAAYSLLLAGATHHLFCFESSLIASVANFWKSAGESLVTLTRSSAWDSLGKRESFVRKFSSLAKVKCSKCCLADGFDGDAKPSFSQGQDADFEDISGEFLDCITRSSRKAWSFLIQGCHQLKLFEDPIDYSWLGKSWEERNVEYGSVSYGADSDPNPWSKKSSWELEGNEYNDARENVYELGVHCLVYGAFLGNVCYGWNSDWWSNIQNILCCK